MKSVEEKERVKYMQEVIRMMAPGILAGQGRE